MREGEKIDKNKVPRNPPTVFHYIIEVKNLQNFGMAFESKDKEHPGIVDLLEARAKTLGYNRVCGLINVRNWNRLESIDSDYDTKPEIVIATTLISKFDNCRQNNKDPSARLCC